MKLRSSALSITVRALNGRIYCKRGEKATLIKEQGGGDASGPVRRPSRRNAQASTRLELAPCGTIRLRLHESGAQVTTSVRRVKDAMAAS